MEQKKENINLFVLIFVILLLIGIIWNFMGFYILNKAEYEIDHTDYDSEDYAHKLNRLNQSKRDSRVINFIGDSAIIFAFAFIIIGIYTDINNKIKNLGKKLDYSMNQKKESTSQAQAHEGVEGGLGRIS